MPSRMNILLEEQLVRDFAEIDNMVLVDYQGLDSEKMAAFRAGLRKNNLKMEVVKNSLFKRVLSKHAGKPLVDATQGKLADTANPFRGPVGVIYGGESAIDGARFAVEWLKANENTIALKAALMGEEVFGPSEIVTLSKLPSRKELLGLMANVVQSPIQKIAATLQASYARMLWAFNALAEKLEKKA